MSVRTPDPFTSTGSNPISTDRGKKTRDEKTTRREQQIRPALLKPRPPEKAPDNQPGKNQSQDPRRRADLRKTGKKAQQIQRFAAPDQYRVKEKQPECRAAGPPGSPRAAGSRRFHSLSHSKPPVSPQGSPTPPCFRLTGSAFTSRLTGSAPAKIRKILPPASGRAHDTPEDAVPGFYRFPSPAPQSPHRTGGGFFLRRAPEGR